MKKLFSLVLAMLMVLSCFAFTASAKDFAVSEGKDVTIAIDDVTAKVGDTVTVKVFVKFAEGHAGISDGAFTVNYPSDKLELVVEATDGNITYPKWLFSGASVPSVTQEAAGSFLAGFANFNFVAPNTAVNGDFFEMQFKVLEGAVGEIGITFDTAAASTYFNTTVNYMPTPVAVELINGSVTVEAAKYSVSFSTEYGTAPDTMTDVEAGTEIDLVTLADTETHRFAGWSDGENTYTDKYTVNSDVTLTAVWNEIVYYDVEYSEGDKVYERVEAGTEITLPTLTNDDLTFLGWVAEGTTDVLAGGAAYIVNGNVNFTAKWGGGRKVYISNDGDNSWDGLTPDTPVRSLSVANELLKVEGRNTLVVVETFTTEKNPDTLGVAGKTITVTGYGENAVFDYDTTKLTSENKTVDDSLAIAGPVIFKNITIYEGSGDGMMRASGNEVVFDEGTVEVDGKPLEIAGWSGSPTITIKSGDFDRVFPGTVSGTYNGGTTTINVEGGSVKTLGLGHGYQGSNKHYGTYYANINGGAVTTITLRSGGVKAANAYKGLRYYTINDGTVGSIVTTGGSQYYNNGTVEARTGVTVFEINKAGVVTGSIALGTNVMTNKAEADNATRLVIFNNGSYEEGKVTDPGAFVYNVKNGALKADVTVSEDYITAVLNGFTYTLPEGSTYNAVKFTQGDIVDIQLLDGDVIDPMSVAGTYEVEFTNAYNVTIDDETTLVEEGDTIALTRLPQNGELKHIGWATTEGATVAEIEHTTDYAPTADVTLYPVWAEAVYFTATFESDHGEVPAPISIIDDDEDGIADTEMTFPGYDGKQDEHFTFAGWIDRDFVGAPEGVVVPVYNAGDTYVLDKNKTFIAKWTEDPKATVTYVDAASTAPEAVTDYVGTEITVAAPGTVEGFEFLGWSDGENVYQAGDKLVIDEDGATLTAKWGVKVAVDANGAKGELPVIGGEIGEEIDLPTSVELTKVNNTFVGFALAPYGEVITGKYTVNPEDTLYVIWEETVADAGIIETKVVYNSANDDYTVDMYFYGQDANTVAFGYTYGENLTFVSFVPAEGLSKVPAALETNEEGYYAFAVTDAIDGRIEGADAEAGNGIHLGTLNFTYELTKEDYSEDDATDNIAITAPEAEVEYISSADYFLYTPAVIDLEVTGLPVVFDEAITYEIVDVVYTVNGSVKVIRADDEAPKNFAKVNVYAGDSLYKTFTIEDAETVTEDGVFEYSIELPAGEYTLVIDKTGYADAEIELVVEAQEGAGEEGFEPTPVEADLVTLVPGDVVEEANVIDLLDFAAITSSFGRGTLAEDIVIALDIDEDGAVTVDDLAYVKANYGYGA